MKSWLLCGPFPALTPGQDIDAIRLPGMYTDYLKNHGCEAGARPLPGQAVSAGGSTRTWIRHNSKTDEIDLDTAVSKENQVVAYAYCEVDSPKPQTSILALGSNDGARAWLNGEAVLDCPGPRGLQMDHNLVPVGLRPGRNSLLLKIEERGNRRGFACRFLPLSAEGLAERLRLFDVIARDDGTPVIRARQSPSLTSAVVKSARP